jgi:hypothetical protein
MAARGSLASTYFLPEAINTCDDSRLQPANVINNDIDNESANTPAHAEPLNSDAIDMRRGDLFMSTIRGERKNPSVIAMGPPRPGSRSFD